MIRLVVELTNRCNLRCAHCFDERHAGSGDLPYPLFRRLLDDAPRCAVTHLSFTGGEPTLHRRFRTIVRDTDVAGCSFSLVSNGSTFSRIYPCLVEHRRAFRGVTFSLDGASEAIHDRLRGSGSFRSVMRAASICVARDLAFTLNMVLTRENRHEIGRMVDLARDLGSGGLRFGHLMPHSPGRGRLELSLAERRAVEDEIWTRRSTSTLPIGMAPGYHADSPWFPCGPLELEEFNVDYRGNVTLCCHLSGYGNAFNGQDRAGNLAEATLGDALDRLRVTVRDYLAAKGQRIARGEFAARDHSPCLYCVSHFERQAAHAGRLPLTVWRS